MGFLVADGGQQAPVETELVRGAHEIRLQFRQHLVVAVDEAARFHVIEAVRERVDLLKQAGKLPAVPDAVVELPDCLDQGVIAPGSPDGPAQGFGGGQVEGRPEFRQGDARPDHFVGRRHRVEDLAVLDHLQQFKAVLVLVQHQVEVRITEAQALEVLRRKGIAGNMQLVGGNVCRRRRADISVAIHHLPRHPLETRAIHQGVVRPEGPGQPGRGQVRLPGGQHVDGLLPAGG